MTRRRGHRAPAQQASSEVRHIASPPNLEWTVEFRQLHCHFLRQGTTQVEPGTGRRTTNALRVDQNMRSQPGVLPISSRPH